MRLARSRGLTIVAGTDPLPMAGEEKYIGSYCSIIAGEFDPSRPSDSIRKLLGAAAVPFSPAGRRCGILEALGRLVRQRVG